MQLIPAIDLLSAKVVRLYKGDMANYTIYSDNPLDQAKKFVDMGVKRLHIVDLDGAKAGDTINYNAIEKIAALSDLKIEVGGGIREEAQLRRYFDIGVSFAILGTVAAKDPDTTKELMQQYPGRIILGIDAKKGIAAVSGWYESSGIKAVDLVRQYADYKADSVIYTDIDKDGTLQGVNLSETAYMAEHSPFPIIASGGVASSADIKALISLQQTNIAGCIIGKAYYDGKIDLAAEIKKL
ncbi:MAG: 1-(5-phosphoribosyl)-5-[(5-phosphoribosylamino)methylideneamino]imidazole-4-carboxamide isomerase [Deferribacteraceae bacterium]|jgi:phosphoribosylformimino-5-aminoimidazole carboxamide ribotide isomerase|nr:1-(5-phosphoribosyl)-5-[(5-phosphoribosylamino)methylideneamino]imidazole-4-carboxamide isomerase [Deferribacteraceae bacterium]